MLITLENLVTEAEKFRSSEELSDFFTHFPVNREVVFISTGCDLDQPITTNVEGLIFARFCQRAWEDLPNGPSIRRPAFFTLCDFAEFWCDEGREIARKTVKPA